MDSRDHKTIILIMATLVIGLAILLIYHWNDYYEGREAGYSEGYYTGYEEGYDKARSELENPDLLYTDEEYETNKEQAFWDGYYEALADYGVDPNTTPKAERGHGWQGDTTTP